MTKTIASSLPFAAAVLAVLFCWWPPEVYVEFRDLSTSLLFLFAFVAAVVIRPPSDSGPRMRTLIAVFFFSLAVSAASGVDAYRSAETILRYASLAVFAAALAAVADGRAADRIETVLIGLTFCLCVYGLHQYLYSLPNLVRQPQLWGGLSKDEILPALTRMAGGRIFSRFALPSSFSCVLLAVLPIVHRRILDRKNYRFYALVMLLITANLVLARSYAAVLLFCAYGWVDAWIRYPRRRRTFLVPSAALAVLALVFLRPESILNFSDPANPVRLRATNWSVAWSEFLSAPAFGVGPGNFALLFPAYTSGLTETRYAHGFHMTILAETGAAGAILWLALAGVFLYRLFRAAPSGAHRPHAASLALMFMYSLVDIVFELPSLSFLFFLLLGLAARSPSSAGPAQRVSPAPALVLSSAGLAFSLVVYCAHGYYEQGMDILRGSRISVASLQSADDLFMKSLRLWPHPETHAARGRADWERYRLSPEKGGPHLASAISHFSAAVRKSPASANGRSALAESLFAAGNITASMVHFKEAARLDPRGPHLKRYTQLLLGQHLQAPDDDRPSF